MARPFPSPGFGESGFRFVCGAAATAIVAAVAGLAATLAIGGWPALRTFGPAFLTGHTWNPVTDVYGAAGPIAGTLVTAALALALALPLALLTALFVAEFSPRRLAAPLGIAVDLLAAIPSVVYGLWGLFVLVPVVEAWFPARSGGLGLLDASLLLALMILPYMASAFRALFATVPRATREAAHALGCTGFEVAAGVVLPAVRRGLGGVAMLGLGRALGETMAVTFVIGNVHALPTGLAQDGATLASTIASEFGEATAPLHVAALTALGLVLFALTFAVLALARLLLAPVR